MFVGNKKNHSLINSSFSGEVPRGVIASLPMLIGFLPFGLLLGAQAAKKGLSALSLGAMTGLNFAGGSEFAAVSLWTSPPQVITILLVSTLVNSRYIIMGASFAPHLYHLPPRKALPILFAMCDESWAIGMADAAKRKTMGLTPYLSAGFYAGLSGAMWFAWLVSTAAGVIIGPMIGDITRWGFDMVFPAIFFVLLRGMWKGVNAAFPWLVSLICSVTTYHFCSGAAYVPVGVISGLTAILLMKKNN